MSAFSLRHRRTALLTAAVAGISTATVLSLVVPSTGPSAGLPAYVTKVLQRDGQALDEGAGAESEEVREALAQFNDARNAPGFAIAGGYTVAADATQAMTASGGHWQEVTNVPYNADDQRYFDYYSNATAGSGYVTGRVQALAAGNGYLFAAGAVGGVFRKHLPDGPWQLISAAVPALSSGALAYNEEKNELWYATGDGATGSTTYTGDGVWVATNATGTPSWRHLAAGKAVGDRPADPNLFDGSVIQQFRFSANQEWVYVPTSFGVWRHKTTHLDTTKWEPVFVPKPGSLPGTAAGSSSDSKSFTANYTTDVAIDPARPNHLVVAYGWVSGGKANGWYNVRLTDNGWTWTKSNVTGAINPKDIGRTTFAWGERKLYALVHNPDHAAMGVSYSELDGLYVSSRGLYGPWKKAADSEELQKANSALSPVFPGLGAVNGGYQPGVQAWYNQFLAVAPGHDNHVYLGLEEVYETKNGGLDWATPGPYWNFFFSCWGTDDSADQFGCPVSTHPDQHAVAVSDGYVYVGNDGGVYRRPVAGAANASGHATDWESMASPAQGTPDLLQYYAVGVGKIDPAKTTYMGDRSYDPNGYIVSGGLQDNGGSILLSGEDVMGSNFGGDGGDVLVDPSDGCRIVQEYVNLSMRVTNVCAATDSVDAWSYTSKAFTRAIRPPETSARFIAPFTADHSDINTWIAGGRHVWLNDKGFNIMKGSEWGQLVDLGLNVSGLGVRTATAAAVDDGDAIVPYCGSCVPGGAWESGYAFGRADMSAGGDDPNHGWTIVTTDQAQVVNGSGTVLGSLPSRYIAGADVYHDGSGQVHYLLAFNGFSRRWIEGPGAGVGHLFESTDGQHWHNLSAGLPDVPANTVKWLGNGRIALGTDLGAFLRDGTSWTRLGDNLPMTVVNDLEPAPDGSLYAATYGRGIWKLTMSNLPSYDGGGAEQDVAWDAYDAERNGTTTATSQGGRR